MSASIASCGRDRKADRDRERGAVVEGRRRDGIGQPLAERAAGGQVGLRRGQPVAPEALAHEHVGRPQLAADRALGGLDRLDDLAPGGRGEQPIEVVDLDRQHRERPPVLQLALQPALDRRAPGLVHLAGRTGVVDDDLGLRVGHEPRPGERRHGHDAGGGSGATVAPSGATATARRIGERRLEHRRAHVREADRELCVVGAQRVPRGGAQRLERGDRAPRGPSRRPAARRAPRAPARSPPGRRRSSAASEPSASSTPAHSAGPSAASVRGRHAGGGAQRRRLDQRDQPRLGDDRAVGEAADGRVGDGARGPSLGGRIGIGGHWYQRHRMRRAATSRKMRRDAVDRRSARRRARRGPPAAGRGGRDRRCARARPRRGRHRRRRRPGVRQQRDGRVRRALRAGGPPAARSRARAAPGAPAARRARRRRGDPDLDRRDAARGRRRGAADRAGHRGRRRCGRSTTTSHRGATSAIRARTCGPGRRSCSAARSSGPAELGVAITAGRATPCAARGARASAILAHRRRARRPRRAARPGPDPRLQRADAARARRAGRRARGHAACRRRPRRDRAGASRQALDEADLVVLSGGVSVGPHDHVKPALAANGVEEVFWRVALRPGKPTWFGVRRADGDARARPARQPGLRLRHVRALRAPGARGAAGRRPGRAAAAPGAAGRRRRAPSRPRRVRSRAHRRGRRGHADRPAGLAHPVVAARRGRPRGHPAGDRRACGRRRGGSPPAR